jgi:hypothetical protein
LTCRFKPAQWCDVTKELDFDDTERNEAVHSLLVSGFIRFMPETTEIIALTSDGIAKGDELLLHLQNPDIRDPMPETLEAIRAELDYWEIHLHDGDPGSNWWEQVQARIEGLRHRENRFLTPVSITNNAIGPNSRNNIYSVDQSSNQASGSGTEQPQVAAAAIGSRTCPFQLQIGFEWHQLSYDLVRGAWRDEQFDPNRLQSLVVCVKNPIAPLGERGITTPSLVSHLKLRSELENVEVDRAYWLGRSTNAVTLQSGQSAGVVVGSFDYAHWVTHSNPYSESPFQGIVPAVIAPLGKKHTIPRVSPIAVTLSILNGGSMATLSQWPFLIHFGAGKLAIQQLESE